MSVDMTSFAVKFILGERREKRRNRRGWLVG